MVLLGIPTDGVDLGDAGDVAQLRTHDPVVQCAQIGGSPLAAIGLARTRLGRYRIHEDFAEPGCGRSHLGLDARRQLRLRRLESLIDELAGEIEVGAILEHDRDLAQAIARDRAGVIEPGNPGERGLDRIGDPLLGFERREAFSLGVDLDLDIGDVRNRVDRQLAGAPQPERDKRGDERHDQPALPDRKTDDARKHGQVSDQ